MSFLSVNKEMGLSGQQNLEYLTVDLEQSTNIKRQSLSRVRLFVTPWTVAHQVFLSMEFSRQECWGGLLFPSPGNLPSPGIEPRSPALQADSLPPEPPGKPLYMYNAAAKPSAGQLTLSSAMMERHSKWVGLGIDAIQVLCLCTPIYSYKVGRPYHQSTGNKPACPSPKGRALLVLIMTDARHILGGVSQPSSF